MQSPDATAEFILLVAAVTTGW